MADKIVTRVSMGYVNDLRYQAAENVETDRSQQDEINGFSG